LGVNAQKQAGTADVQAPRSIRTAANTFPSANLAVISVPGEYAAAEAFRALNADLHVMIFSDNVSLAEEVALKKLATQKGLLVMGPDCGTAIINGTSLCFANAISSGPIGIVGASGTGIQEATVLIDRLGSGISQAIGTGGRDLSDDIGGITALTGIDLLEKDANTAVLLIISKPPGKQTAKKLLERLKSCTKPVVLALLGETHLHDGTDGIYSGATIEAAVAITVFIAQGRPQIAAQHAFSRHELLDVAKAEAMRIEMGRVFLRGLYSGGTLAEEARLVLTPILGRVQSNTAKLPEMRPLNLLVADNNCLIDLGDDEFTRGRPHPMIDPSYRATRLQSEYQDPNVAVILCDIVLGYGSHPNPAEVLASAVKKARGENKHYVPVVCSVCGTDKDPQNRTQQERLLQDAGIILAPSNAYAAELAGAMAAICAQRGQTQ